MLFWGSMLCLERVQKRIKRVYQHSRWVASRGSSCEVAYWPFTRAQMMSFAASLGLLLGSGTVGAGGAGRDSRG